MRSICNHVRPDRQTLLFSATFKKRIEILAREILSDPVKIVQGDVGEANEDVTQHVILFKNPAEKWTWLLSEMVSFMSTGSVLIFVTKKADAELVATNLRVQEYDVLLLHGDIDQSERNKVITKFKKRECDILVATDVAARGLDIPHIRTVVNYDIARDIDTHTHRVGRTGRAGEKGTAFTLVTDKDKEFSGHLVRNLEGANQEVPNDLLELAMQSSWFRNSRFKNGKAKPLSSSGLGFKERPGFGMTDDRPQNPFSTSSSSSTASSASSASTGFSGPSNSKSSSGPATNRFSAMRDAFRNQYNSQVRLYIITSHDKVLLYFTDGSHILYYCACFSFVHQQTEHGKKRYQRKEFLQPPPLQTKILARILIRSHRKEVAGTNQTYFVWWFIDFSNTSERALSVLTIFIHNFAS